MSTDHRRKEVKSSEQSEERRNKIRLQAWCAKASLQGPQCRSQGAKGAFNIVHTQDGKTIACSVDRKEKFLLECREERGDGFQERAQTG